MVCFSGDFTFRINILNLISTPHKHSFLLILLMYYRIYSINRPGRLLNFLTLRVDAYSRWAFIRGWALIKFSPFSESVVVYFATKQ